MRLTIIGDIVNQAGCCVASQATEADFAGSTLPTLQGPARFIALLKESYAPTGRVTAPASAFAFS